MHEAQVCVVTPVRNGGRYLAEAIESVLAQTLPNWEYVIMDGGSEDDSLRIARRYERKDHRIRVISAPDKGMYDALFKGFDHTIAPICCWIPCDDKFMPWAFEVVSRYVAWTGANWVTGIPARWDRRGLLHHVGIPQYYVRPLIRRGFYDGRYLAFIQQASTFFTRSLLKRIGSDEVEMITSQKGAGDFLLWTRFARHSQLETIPTVLSGFRQHGENWSVKQKDVYYAEMANMGFYGPFSRVLGRLLRLLIWPIAAWQMRRIYANWQGALNTEVHCSSPLSSEVHEA